LLLAAATTAASDQATVRKEDSTMTRLDPARTVGEIVAERPSRSRVFEGLGIDYCCGGHRPLDAACRGQGVATEQVLDSLAAHDASTAGSEERDWRLAPTAELIDHILETHHAYLAAEMPRLAGLAEKVAKAHGPRHPYVHELKDVYASLRDELESHMAKEEQILFPMIRQMDAGASAPAFHCGSVQGPIRQMEFEHDSAAVALGRMRELTSGYTPPEDACNTFRALLDGLAGFEADLHAHIHKENNILFPRVAETEGALEY
jgi:regulator of cell morphogenesis and NO signaling